MILECSVCDTYVDYPGDFKAGDNCFYAPDCSGTLMLTEHRTYPTRMGICDYCGYDGLVRPTRCEDDDFVHLCEECEP